MPGMNGYDLCSKIREQYPANKLPIIMLTAKNQITDLINALEGGANDYISKPFSKNELIISKNSTNPIKPIHFFLTFIHFP